METEIETAKQQHVQGNVLWRRLGGCASVCKGASALRSVSSDTGALAGQKTHHLIRNQEFAAKGHTFLDVGVSLQKAA